MMKKCFVSFSTLLALICLVACQANSSSHAQSEAKLKATLTVKFADKTESKEVTFEKDDHVMDILEDNFKVEEEDGLVTSINGVSQDASKNTYWMYDVNGELAPKGAEEMTVSEGDKIEFYLRTFQ